MTLHNTIQHTSQIPYMPPNTKYNTIHITNNHHDTTYQQPYCHTTIIISSTILTISTRKQHNTTTTQRNNNAKRRTHCTWRALFLFNHEYGMFCSLPSHSGYVCFGAFSDHWHKTDLSTRCRVHTFLVVLLVFYHLMSTTVVYLSKGDEFIF